MGQPRAARAKLVRCHGPDRAHATLMPTAWTFSGDGASIDQGGRVVKFAEKPPGMGKLHVFGGTVTSGIVKWTIKMTQHKSNSTPPKITTSRALRMLSRTRLPRQKAAMRRSWYTGDESCRWRSGKPPHARIISCTSGLKIG